MNVMGVTMDGNVRAWSNPQRRVGGLLAFGAAVVVLVAALVVYFTAGNAASVYWTLVVLLVLVLAFVLFLMFAKPRSAIVGEAHLGPGAPATLAEAQQPAPESAPIATTPTITLRCGDCGTVFDVPDNGERPLYHTCPGCGAEGILRDVPAIEAPPTPVAPAPPPKPEPVAAPAPASAPVIRKLKLRCGNCKEVFAIEDTGERPLRRPCPYCSRMGEIR